MMQPDILARLLRDGAGVLDPDETTVTVAEQLRDLGVVRLRWTRFVRCAEPGDSDFSRSNRHCPGRIYLGRSNQDWFRCPECERLVYPEEDQKRSFRELCVRVLPQGVCHYVEQSLGRVESGFRSLAGGVYQVPLGAVGVVVCVVDYCAEQRFLTREWASTHPTCYLGVNARAFDDRFVKEPWLCRLRLVDILAGEVDLATTLQQLASSNGPAALQHVSMPVYSWGPLPLAEDPGEQHDLADRQAEKREELWAALAAWRRDVGATFPAGKPCRP